MNVTALKDNAGLHRQNRDVLVVLERPETSICIAMCLVGSRETGITAESGPWPALVVVANCNAKSTGVGGVSLTVI